MTFRKFDTGTWVDPWFEKLSPKAKLAFIYLWTNEICNQAGFYELSESRAKFELGYGIDTIYSEINNKVLWYRDRNLFWIKNFFKRQCQNSKFAISALNSIKQDLFRLQLFIIHNKPLLDLLKINLERYHIDTVSIPYPTEAEAEADTEKENTPLPPTGGNGSVLKIYDYPDWLNKNLWSDFHRMRSRIKKPITTERTIAGLLNKLKSLIDEGNTQDEIIQAAIDNCWQSFYPAKSCNPKKDDKEGWI
jgi:hypothetical protein